MAITYKKTVAIFDGICEIEEAEALLEWLIEHPKGKVNLKACEHPHPAVLQVLMACKPTVSSWPDIPDTESWMRPALGMQQ